MLENMYNQLLNYYLPQGQSRRRRRYEPFLYDMSQTQDQMPQVPQSLGGSIAQGITSRPIFAGGIIPSIISAIVNRRRG